jgi:predicted permease
MFRHKRDADDFAEEIKAHLALEEDELTREGLSEKEARRKARREFGNVRAAQERLYLRGRAIWLDNLGRDFRFAFRQMRRSPGFVIASVMILALGIAANVIVFGVVQAMILQPINVPHPDQVMTFAPHDGGFPEASFPEIRDVRDDSTVFSAVAAEGMQVFGLEADGATQPVWGDEVSGQFFEAMQIKPFLGRLLQRSDDDHPGASEAAVLSWAAWNSRFHANPAVIGETVRINKHPYTIVGVTEKSYYGTQKFLQPDLFVPMANEASLEGNNWLDDRRQVGISPVVRIKDGVTRAQAQAELDAIALRIQRQDPKEEDGAAFKLAPIGLVGDFLGRPARRFMAGIMVLAGILLLAACANLGSLFASRTADRAREIAIRMALGSSRWRVVRQVLIEAFLISILGGLCAYGLAWITLTGLAQWHPPSDYPIKFMVEPQPSLILPALLISVLSGLLFGLLPLRQIFRADPNEAIKNGGNQAAGGSLFGLRGWALRDLLLAAQIALCCITITAAFVSLRGLSRSLTVDRGFNPNNVVMTRFDLSQGGYAGETAERFQRQLVERVSHLPGVQAAGYANSTPLSDTPTAPVFTQQTTDLKPTNKAFDTYFYNASPEYLATAQTPLLEGRGISVADTAKTPPVAVVNQQFVRHLFHAEHAIGRYFKDNAGHSIQIVGMVADGKYFTLSEDPEEAAFFPILQQPGTATSLIVRTRAEALEDTPAAIRKVIHDLDPAIPIRVSGSWMSALAFNLFPTQVATISLGLFGAFGLLLSITGTFGLASYTVSKRLRELSIRVALGAQARQIVSAALGRILILLAGGLFAGLLLGMAVSRVLAAIVYQASAQDPVVLLAVACTMLFTGALSVANPVRRALHVDPVRMLREQ